MPHQETEPPFDIETEYRAIETALLETARGRWFLTEHSRRSRRLETTELESALTSLKASLRSPPALLGLLQSELETVAGLLEQARADLLARESSTAPAGAPGTPSQLLDAAEQLHRQAWQLQANQVDPELCERIGRQTAVIFAMSARQAQEAHRSQRHAATLDGISDRVAAVLRTIVQEAASDDLDQTPVLARSA